MTLQELTTCYNHNLLQFRYRLEDLQRFTYAFGFITYDMNGLDIESTMSLRMIYISLHKICQRLQAILYF